MAVEDANTGRRPRVTFVILSLSPLLGMEAATVALANALTTDYEVQVVLLAGDESGVPLGDSVDITSWGKPVPDWERAITLLRAFRHRNELDSDVIIVSGVWTAIPIALTLPKKLLARTLIWEHSFDRGKVTTSRDLALMQAAARKVYPRAFATVTVSESPRLHMRKAGFNERIEVIPNIVPEFDSWLVRKKLPGRLLAVGSLTKTKNQALALQTLAQLPDYYSLDILGDGPERSTLERLADKLGIAHRVRFHGYVPNPAEYYSQSQIVIHPSLGETYGLVLFEAADFSTPVVAADRSVMAQVIPHLVPGRVAEPQTDAFASAIRSLEDGPISEREFSEAAHRRKSVSRSIVGDWKRLIDETMESSTAGLHETSLRR